MARGGPGRRRVRRHLPGDTRCQARGELLNGEIFYTLCEAQIVIESWRRHYNTIHASIGYSHQHQRCSCLHSPRGRLRYADQLRRPRWRNRQP
jgi:hypothetical protein